ncbi:anthranilate synthase component I [Pirellulaceae bacterium SH467]|jgi:anthranilate synthase component 1
MSTFPSFDEFQSLAPQFDLIPVWKRLLSDHLTPVTAFRQLDDGMSSACLFESVVGGEKIGRYSFIAIGPRTRMVATRDQVEWHEDGKVTQHRVDDPLAFLRDQVSGKKVATLPGLPPFVGGAIGFAGYDVIRYVENLPNAPKDDRHLPDLDFGFYDQLIVFDNVNKTVLVLQLVAISTDKDPSKTREAYDAASDAIQSTIEKLRQPLPLTAVEEIDTTHVVADLPQSNFTREGFEEAVLKCREYILAGDIFQVVLSQRFEVEASCDPFEIYRTLRVVNPSPFMFFVRTPSCSLVGSSPEVMSRVFDRVVTVRPLAGTRPRGKSSEEDRRLADDLINDPKERAEHVMLVDLGRNDIGRVAKFGSVRLSDLMVVEHYSHVMHISSNVTGELREDMDAMDAFKSCLPAGTVSGAPKVRAMEIIDELEPTRRGPYAGAVGYFDYRGNMDTCITLRTMVICNGKIYVQAGAGLVADSDPASEYLETVNKSKAQLAAIEITKKRQSAS